MKRLKRYLVREILGATSATFAVLLVVFMSNQTVRIIKAAAYGPMADSLIKVVIWLQVPVLTAVILPAALFLGILLAYGRLAADSELIIFAACGLNPKRLVAVTVKFSLVMAGLVALLSVWVNPKLSRCFDQLLHGTTASRLAAIKPKYFTELFNNTWVIYAEANSPDKQRLEGVFLARLPRQSTGDQRVMTLVAKSAYCKKDLLNEHNSYIVLVDGHQYLGIPGQRDYEVVSYEEYGIKIPNETKWWHSSESSLSTGQLIQEQKHNPKAAAELQWRWSLPLMVIILTLIALLLSNKAVPGRGRYAKMMPAIIIYIFYANFLLLAKAWIKKEVISAEMGMWWVHGLILLIAAFLLAYQLKIFQRTGEER